MERRLKIMSHKVDATTVATMKSLAVDLGLDPEKAAQKGGRKYHDQCAYSIASSYGTDSHDWTYVMRHAHYTMGVLEAPFRPKKKGTPKNEEVTKMVKHPSKKVTVEIGRLVPGGLKLRITNKKGTQKEKVWKCTRRKHEYAVADFLTSSVLARITKYAPVVIVIRKRQVK
jgi:hypothetical protein